jgi:hypothetical protein
MPPLAKAQPKPLVKLIDKLTTVIGGITSDLEDGTFEVDAWQKAMERELTTFHASAYMAGARQMTLDEAARKRIAGDVRVQLQFLDNFSLEIQSASDFEEGWKQRAASYADAIQIPFWAGRTKMLPLPALPGEGSQCQTHCKCLWSVDTLDEEAGDWDATWIRSVAESCQTCVERAQEWSPLRIRGGVLQ